MEVVENVILWVGGHNRELGPQRVIRAGVEECLRAAQVLRPAPPGSIDGGRDQPAGRLAGDLRTRRLPAGLIG